MTSLYVLANEYAAVQGMDPDACASEAIINTLEGIKDEFDNKAVAVVKVTMNMAGEIDQIDAEINRLKAHKQARVNAIARLRQYLKENMERTGINNISHPLFSITLAKPRKMVRITDEHALPDDYVSVESIIKPDKARLLKDLSEGTAVPGAELVDAERGLIIK